MLRYIFLTSLAIANIGYSFYVNENAKSSDTTLKMLSFNVQVFGVTKMSKQPVVDLLVDIFSRYDIGMMMEIRDSSNTSFWQLVDDINNSVKDKGNDYSYAGVVSDRFGRSSSKEQYGYIYRTDKVTFENMWQYDDSKDDIFERPPCVATFTDNNFGKKINYLAIHTSPSYAVAEMNGLVDVYNQFSKTYSTDELILAGDFNAGCSYVSQGPKSQRWGNICYF